MRQTKLGFDMDEFKEIYKGQKTEKVWIDFGRFNSKMIKYNPEKTRAMDFNGDRLYYMLPPGNELKPSNVIIFEIVYISSRARGDKIVGWGAFPIVNGEFELNTGKFKVPLLSGDIQWEFNKFKDIEQKYKRNIDEWLCNLYIQIRRVDLFDFRQHEEKIGFTVPKSF